MMIKAPCTKHQGPDGGYTLIELVVAVGLFALIMTLVSGAYLIMISLVRHTQAMASGIDNLSFALESMTRDIRTGTAYSCGGSVDCPLGGSAFSFTDMNGRSIAYGLSGSAILETTTDGSFPLTDSSAVQISSLEFFVSGTSPFSTTGDTHQPYVTIIISGTVRGGDADEPPQSFTVETSAVMRGTDL